MTSNAHILVVDDEPDIREVVKDILEDEGLEVSVAKDATEAREARRTRKPDLILLDIWMPDTDGITLLKEWAGQGDAVTPVIMMSGHGTVETAVEATRLGALDFIEKPLSMAKLLLAVNNGLTRASLQRENQGLRRETQAVNEPIGNSEVIQKLRDNVRRIAQHDAPVFIMGESGSGKEVSARYLHQTGSRSNGPFVRVSVGALVEANASTELFGAEDGDSVVFGHLEHASGGILFIKDLVELDLGVQARLLSALEQKRFLRVDGVRPVEMDVRVVAATRHDPARAVENGLLRADLYYQLNVVPLSVPPLRAHREDIPALLEYYADQLVTKEGLSYRRFSVGAQNRLRNHEWPGNIRELKNLVHRLLILGNGEEISADEIELALGGAPRSKTSTPQLNVDLPLKDAREQFERRYLEQLIRDLGGNVAKVAVKAGFDRTHLYRKFRALGIDPKSVAAADD